MIYKQYKGDKMKKIAKNLVHDLGGKPNIEHITHCATRIRVKLDKYDESILNKLNEYDEIIEAFQQDDGLIQLVVGPQVVELYESILFYMDEEIVISEQDGHKNLLEQLFESISAIFTPLFPIMAGSGVLRGVLILLSQLGIISDTSDTYIILTAASKTVFHFLPLMLAVTSARKFGASPYVSLGIVGSLLVPDFLNLMGDDIGTKASFLGIPVVMMDYHSTVIPAILSIYVYTHLEDWLEKRIPESLQLLLVPMLGLIIMVPLTSIVFGPFGVYVGEIIASMIEWFMNKSGLIAGAIIAGVWNVLVIFGVQWAINPIMIQNISTVGYDFIVPLTGAANLAMAGAAFAVFLRVKDSKEKSYSLSSLISILFAGITEPAIYGVALKYKTPLIGAIVGGAMGGAYMGLMKVKANAFVFGALTTIPAFAGPTLLHYVIGLLICFVGSAMTTILLFKE